MNAALFLRAGGGHLPDSSPAQQQATIASSRDLGYTRIKTRERLRCRCVYYKGRILMIYVSQPPRLID
uniref:Uncharacterized protein n=1 Tax=Hyaloperonospora arabidopsidis (strain Emoy2) TaxID=559515 RepID=M4BU30_HYAAE